MSKLGQHLLTRSDLARLSVPAARILSWLANGWLDQIGALPDGRSGGDPVFTVTTRELRLELAARLASIGKTSVVFTPLRVRSLLLRAMLTERMPKQTSPDGGDEGIVLPPIELANHLEYSDLGDVLQEAISELQLEMESVQRIAEEEAALEAAEVEEQPAVTDRDLEPAHEQDEAEFFDTDALVDELASWDSGEEAAAEPAEDLPAQATEAEPAEATEPADPVDEPEAFGPTAQELDALRDALAASIADYRSAGTAFGENGEIPALSPQAFADSIERLSATLDEVQSLANEAAALGDAMLRQNDEEDEEQGYEPHAPTPEMLAQLGMLDDPTFADAAADAAPPEEQEPPSVEALEDAADSIFDQLTMLDDPEAGAPKNRSENVPDVTEGPAKGPQEEAVHEVPDQPDAPVTESLVDLEALDPRDVLPDAEPAAAAADPSASEALDAVFGGDAAPEAATTTEEPREPDEAPVDDAATAAAAEEATSSAAADAGATEQPAPPEQTVVVEPTAAAVPTMPHAEVQTFLTELRETLVELARQPSPPPPPPSPPDLEPLVATVRDGFARSQTELAQTNVAIGSLVQCVGDLGKRLGHQLAYRVQPNGSVALAEPAPRNVGASRSTWVLLAACLLIMAWSAVLWWKTGNAKLSIGTLLGANAVACCLLVGRGRD